MRYYFEAVGYIFVGLLVAFLMGLSIWAEFSVWDECRAEHSFWYCWRVLSK